jgi:hypothetical protein
VDVSLPLGSRAIRGLTNYLLTSHNSESDLLCDWRFTANQFVLAPSPLRPTTSIFFQLDNCGYSPYVPLSLTGGCVRRLHLLLTLAIAAILGSESCGTHDHILLSQIRDTPQPGGPGPRIFIPQEQDGPVIPPGTGFPFLLTFSSSSSSFIITCSFVAGETTCSQSCSLATAVVLSPIYTAVT